VTTRTSAPITVTAEPGQLSIATERAFDAPRELVFRCWSEADLVRRWLGPKRLEMRIDEWDFRHGGAYRYVHVEQDGTEYGFRGVFHGPLSPDAMVQTFEFEGAPGHVSLDRLELVDLGDGRTLAKTFSVYGSVASRDAMIEHGMTDGMEQGYQQLETLLGELAGQA
jgi:uncharacterized protein YndB with AHSA1/START domain